MEVVNEESEMTSNANNPPSPRTLAATVRKYRERAGLSIRQLAALAGLHHSYLARLENGDNDRPTPEVLQGIARALKIDAVKLLRFIGVKPAPAKLPAPRVYFRRAYHLNADEAAEAERQIENILQGLRKHTKRTNGNNLRGGTKP